MSYLTQARMSEDTDLMRRIAACAASEGVTEYATTWAARNQWSVCAAPGWDDAYAYAINSGSTAPGADESVITDAQILSAVQAVIATLAPPDPGNPDQS